MPGIKASLERLICARLWHNCCASGFYTPNREGAAMKKLFAFAEHNLRGILIHSLSVLAILLLPSLGRACVSFKWVPTDGSSSSGVMTIDAPSSGGFSVPPSAVTLFGFSFGPGKSVSLDNAQPLNDVNGQGQMIPIVSFNGNSLDTGVFDLRLLANPAVDVYITFIYSGSDASQYDPGGQEIRVHGNWVRISVCLTDRCPRRHCYLGGQGYK